MKTDELITLLATGAGSVGTHAAARRFASVLGWGALAAALLMAIMLGVRSDIEAAARLPMFWIKLAFPAALASASLVAALRLSRPGAQLGWVPVGLLAPALAIGLLAIHVLLDAPTSERMALVMGSTWKYCLADIPKLSVPLLVATLWAMKGLAPTRLALAGAAAGLLAATIGALVYALHCPEMDAPFLAVWYVAGMLIPTAVGALVGPFVLRW